MFTWEVGFAFGSGSVGISRDGIPDPLMISGIRFFLRNRERNPDNEVDVWAAVNVRLSKGGLEDNASVVVAPTIRRITAFVAFIENFIFIL